MEASAFILVSSTATTPIRASPAAAHRASTSAKTPSATPSVSWRNRAMVLWSAGRPAQMTRKATSIQHSCSVRRDERTPVQ